MLHNCHRLGAVSLQTARSNGRSTLLLRVALVKTDMHHSLAIFRIALAVAFVAAAAFGGPQSAQAGQLTRAEELINRGLELRRAGEDAEALQKFEEAYRLAASPRASAQLGLCLQALGRWSEADERLAEALRAKNDPWVNKNRTVIKDSIEQVKQNIARVEVHGGPDGATVNINGKNVGTYPLAAAVPVNAGNVDIEVVKPGFKRGYRSLSVAGGSYQRLLIRLEEAEAPAVAAAATVPTSSPTMQAEAQLSANADSNEGSQGDPIYKKAWFWGVIGAVAAAGVLAVVLSSGGGGTTGPMIDDKGTFGQ